MEKKIFKKLFLEISVIFILTSLTLGLIIWILQAVSFLDIISEDGHSIATYFKFSLLGNQIGLYRKCLDQTHSMFINKKFYSYFYCNF